MPEAWLEAAQPLAGLEDGDGVEGRLPAASRIPHAADGLVRAAALADPVGGRGRQDRASTARCRTCARCASRSATSPTCSPRATRSRSRAALERMLAMRAYMRAKTIDGVIDESIARRVGLTGPQIEDMYQIMAIANYEDRFVIPTAHRELGEDAYDLRGSCGFSFGNGCSDGAHRDEPVRRAASAEPRPRWRSRDAQDLQGARPRC